MKAARSLWTLGQGFRPHGLFARSFLFPVVQRQPYLQGSWSTVLVNGPAPRCLSTKRIPNYEVKGPERTHKTDKDRAKIEKRRLKREAKAPELIDLRIAIIGLSLPCPFPFSVCLFVCLFWYLCYSFSLPLPSFWY